MAYIVSGLQATLFQHLYGMSDADLERHGARRYIADRKPGFPDRIEVRDVEPGDAVILLNFMHQPVMNPYQSSHAIFVREGATQTYEGVDCLPEVLRIRPISLRAFNNRNEMIDANLVDGERLEPLIERFLANEKVNYLHAHYAKRGCYAARIERR